MSSDQPEKFQTDQERFWAGTFGDEYVQRNQGKDRISSNVALFEKVLSLTQNISSIFEFGANVGLNLRALQNLIPNVRLAAAEINPKGIEILRQIRDLTVHPISILDFEAKDTYDFVLSKGLLIHLSPDKLPNAYSKLYETSQQYICLVEYYNPTPIEVSYRGHTGKLFKRDFAGDLLDNYPDLSLIDYGFVYHRDPKFPKDDVTWFLLEKSTE